MAQKMQAKMVALALTALVLAHGAVGALIDDCKADPSTADCADSETYYNNAAVAADVKGLCEMMPQMPSCRIRELCESGEIADTSGHCGEWNLLSGICSTQYGESMQGMAGCTTYKMICADGSVNLNEICTFVDKSAAAPLHARFILVLSGLVRLHTEAAASTKSNSDGIQTDHQCRMAGHGHTTVGWA
eukprot:2924298-Rhodomonas_salina.1